MHQIALSQFEWKSNQTVFSMGFDRDRLRFIFVLCIYFYYILVLYYYFY